MAFWPRWLLPRGQHKALFKKPSALVFQALGFFMGREAVTQKMGVLFSGKWPPYGARCVMGAPCPLRTWVKARLAQRWEGVGSRLLSQKCENAYRAG